MHFSARKTKHFIASNAPMKSPTQRPGKPFLIALKIEITFERFIDFFIVHMIIIYFFTFSHFQLYFLCLICREFQFLRNKKKSVLLQQLQIMQENNVKSVVCNQVPSSGAIIHCHRNIGIIISVKYFFLILLLL